MSSIAGPARFAACLSIIVLALTPAAFAQPSASEFYLAYRKAFEAAAGIEGLLPFLSASARRQVEATPADDRVQMFEFMKMIGARRDVTIVGEETTAEGTVLSVDATAGDGSHTHGTITLIREDGVLKLSQERWSAGAHQSEPPR